MHLKHHYFCRVIPTVTRLAETLLLGLTLGWKDCLNLTTAGGPRCKDIIFHHVLCTASQKFDVKSKKHVFDQCFTATGGATIPERLRGVSGISTDGWRRGELWEKGRTVGTESWSQECLSGSTCCRCWCRDALHNGWSEKVKRYYNKFLTIYFHPHHKSVYLFRSDVIHQILLSGAASRCCRLRSALIRIKQRQKANTECLILIWMRLTITVRAGVCLLRNSAFRLFLSTHTHPASFKKEKKIWSQLVFSKKALHETRRRVYEAGGL